MTKTNRVYMAFMEGKSFNRFDAEKVLHDHCLHSTVSTLQQKHRINISRRFEIVRGYQGNPTSVCRYWIDIKERQRIKSVRQEQKANKKANKKAANPTDQDKENGSNYSKTNPTDEQGKSQISTELD